MDKPQKSKEPRKLWFADVYRPTTDEPPESKKPTVTLSTVLSEVLSLVQTGVPFIAGSLLSRWAMEHGWFTLLFCAVMGPLLVYILVLRAKRLPLKSNVSSLLYGVLLITNLQLGKWLKDHEWIALFLFALIGLFLAYILYIILPWPIPGRYRKTRNRPVPE